MVGKTQSNINIIGVAHREGGRSFWKKLLLHEYQQIEISLKIASELKKADFLIFFIGTESALLPMLTAKLLRKKVAVMLVGNPYKVAEVTKGALGKILSMRKAKFTFNMMLSNKIIVYSKSIIKERGLEQFQAKIFFAPEHFIDLGLFNARKKISERTCLVGYIGRLSEEKGVLNFVKAIPGIIDAKKDVTFLVGGDGHLANEVKSLLVGNNIQAKVKMVGWISHEDLSAYLNELTLLVLPSFTEGLPNIMLEAMACGTPVLASSVGAIPDVIIDGENGFLLSNNSTENMVSRIMEIINRTDLQNISNNARKTIEEEFSYRDAVKKFSNIL